MNTKKGTSRPRGQLQGAGPGLDYRQGRGEATTSKQDGARHATPAQGSTIQKFGAKISNFMSWPPSSQPNSHVEAAVNRCMQEFKGLESSPANQSLFLCRMFEVLTEQLKVKLPAWTWYEAEVLELRERTSNLQSERDQLAEEIDIESAKRIKDGVRAGVFQKTAEQDSLQGAITSYFADDLPTFVNSFHGDDVLGVEDHISRQFVAAFEKGRDVLVQNIVRYCRESPDQSDVAKMYRTMKEKCSMKPREVLVKFLSAQVYTDAFLQTGSLSPSDWELRKFAIYLKSTYLEYAKEKEDTTSVQKAMKETFATSWRSAELPKVNEFLSKTVHLLLEMLMSESPVIPWNELKRIEPKLVDVIPSQHHSQQATFDDEVSYHAPKFYCKRPILLSCSHAQVKIYQGRIVEVKERKR